MWEYIKNLIWEGVKKFAEWFLDLFVWLFEWIFWLINKFFEWFLAFLVELLAGVVGTLKGYIPDGLFDSITAVYEWAQYINDWVPLDYGIGLFVSYLVIRGILTVLHWIIKLIPGIGG